MRQAVLGALRSLPATPYVPYPLYTHKHLGFNIARVVRPLHTCSKQHLKYQIYRKHFGFIIGLVFRYTPAQCMDSNTLGTLGKSKHPEVRTLPVQKKWRDGVKPFGSVGGVTGIKRTY